VHLGASYQSKIDFERFEKYDGLFAENGDMDVPSTYNLGVAFDNDDFTVALDYQVINYSEVASIANSLMPNLGTAKLGSDNGAGYEFGDIESRYSMK
jgi:long-chain fatty acid transport protein